jgi:high-affinity Fe2+/Pb2+ permease
MFTAYDLAMTIVFMTIVFGLAATVLWLVDKLSLPRNATEGEKKTIVQKRTGRWHKLWRISFVIMVAVSLPLNLVGLFRKTEPLFPTIVWIVLAVIVLLGLLSPFHGGDKE